jgi:hypothetical protein
LGHQFEKEFEVVTEVEGQLSTLKHRDHVCLIYHDPDDQLTVAVFFVKLRLAFGDRCIYIAAEWSAADIRRPLVASGVGP